MAHEITQYDTMVSGMGETPWHGLGTVVEGALTAQEALDLGGLNWSVLRGNNYRQKFDAFEAIPNSYHLFRSNDGVVVNEHCTDDYVEVQNSDLFTFFDGLVSRKEAMYHTAGSLKGGRIVWILAKLPGEIVLPGDDITQKFCLVGASHDGSLPVFMKMTPVRVVCWNTLTQAFSGKMGDSAMKGDMIKIRHSAQAQDKMKAAADGLGLMNKQYELFGQAALALRAKALLSTDNIRSYFQDCFEMDAVSISELSKRGATVWANKARKLEELHETGLGSELCRGTAWGAYNAVTEFADHHGNEKGQDARVQGSWLPGPKETLKRRALELALKL